MRADRKSFASSAGGSTRFRRTRFRALRLTTETQRSTEIFLAFPPCPLRLCGEIGELNSPHMRSIITGTGIGIPKNVVRNEVLSRIMDTSDEWIRTRSGIEQRYYADPGQGSAELGMMAAEGALAAAKRDKSEIDGVIFATMTPNHFFPGNGPLLQARMGLSESIPTF